HEPVRFVLHPEAQEVAVERHEVLHVLAPDRVAADSREHAGSSVSSPVAATIGRRLVRRGAARSIRAQRLHHASMIAWLRDASEGAIIGPVLGRHYDNQDCSAARALELVGERWSLLILRDAMFGGITRFSQFQKGLGIATNVLAERLEGFVAAGLME